MSYITWNELKVEVDRQLAEKGLTGDEEISWFDLPAGSEVEDIFVHDDGVGSINVSG